MAFLQSALSVFGRTVHNIFQDSVSPCVCWCACMCIRTGRCRLRHHPSLDVLFSSACISRPVPPGSWSSLLAEQTDV